MRSSRTAKIKSPPIGRLPPASPSGEGREGTGGGGGAPPQVKMIIDTHAIGPFFKNGFVLGCEETHEAVLIDPGEEVNALLRFADTEGLVIRHILLTHAHVDHVTGVAAAKRALGSPVYLHRDDLFLYEG